MNKISEAVQEAGGITALARLLGVKPPTVHQWVSGVRPVPPMRCLDIERVTNGKVTCEQLLPNQPWSVLRNTASHTAAGQGV